MTDIKYPFVSRQIPCKPSAERYVRVRKGSVRVRKGDVKVRKWICKVRKGDVRVRK